MYLGGYNQTIKQKSKRVREVLGPLEAVGMGWTWQCRCGGSLYVRYRGRFYCQKCGKRIVDPDVRTIGRDETFRKQFERS